ncbi:flagellar basal body P-ring formation chaperone FlgA [Thiomicrorhabdus sp. 6S3-12]|uniref:flagellar basal body P-ring formation chaperone FlgA n=1 Tax=Thiomicrorhabdus sp. 6S3-12 TaxID=2819681 RepID=UPI001FB72AC7|nr:flagellar basal body P-ring formation chaperone FlgA [Thiomicrorhabdus sp. 6S3-12]
MPFTANQVRISFFERLFLAVTGLIMLFTLTPEALATEQYQSVDEIHQRVLEHIKQKANQKILEPTFKIRELNKNLKLGKCQGVLEISDRNPNDYVGRMTIGVGCETPKWQVYIPAEVDGKVRVVMTTQALLKKTTISADKVKEVLIPYRKAPRQSLQNMDTAIGMRTKRPIGAGQILKARDLQPPYLVFKNHKVNIVTYIGNIEVKTTGTAQADAVKNEQVAVKNSASGKTVKGIVIAPNTVYIP